MDELSGNLLKRAIRTFGGRPVAQAVVDVRAIVGPIRFATDAVGEDKLVQDAQAGLDALRQDPPAEPTPRQFQALVVLIQLTRPAVESQASRLESLPKYERGDPTEQEARAKAWSSFGDSIAPLLYSVGRIDDASGERHYGTGFVVRPGVLLTNKHVLMQASVGTGRLERGQLQVNFRQEWRYTDGEAPLPVQSVIAIHPDLDMVLLEIPKEPERPSLAFDCSPLGLSCDVVAIGYSYEDPVNSQPMMERIYQGRYGVKLATPGEVIGLSENHFYHDCSTLGGNSGSPLFAMESGRVVGLHRSGTFVWRNQAIQAQAVVAFVT